MTYVYRCPWCGWEMETQHSMSENPVYKCRWCGGEMKRVPQAVPIHFKTPRREVRFKREEAQRIRGNREMYEGLPGSYEAHAEHRARQRAAREEAIRGAKKKMARWFGTSGRRK